MSTKKRPPAIPHVTTNYVSLAGLVSNLVYHVHSELQNALETLPSVSSDLMRKRRLLDVLIKSRQEFLKLYVLCKWAPVSSDISTCIDVVAWLNGQQNCFNNVVNILYNIERSLGAAKLRNPDIQSALQVLTYGRPIHDSKGFLPPPPLSSQTVLHTLRDLNVLLSVRLALSENLPPHYRDFHIADGRVRFTIDSSYYVDLAVADDRVDSRFFFVGFRFCFPGCEDLQPPIHVRLRLETIVNRLLESTDTRNNNINASSGTNNTSVVTTTSTAATTATSPSTTSLQSAFDFLLKFTQNYKLSYLSSQLIQLQRGIWTGVLSHAFFPDKSLINIRYWLPRPGPHSVLRIGLINKHYSLGVVWMRDGVIVPSAKNPDFKSTVDLFANANHPATHLDIDTLINRVVGLHIRHIVSSIHDSLNERGLKCSLISSGTKLRLDLCEGRQVLFSVDSLTGRFIVQSHNMQIVHYAEKKLNALSDWSSGPAVADILCTLRYVSMQSEIILRATACGWIHHKIALAGDQIAKVVNSAATSTKTGTEKTAAAAKSTPTTMAVSPSNLPTNWFTLRLSDWPLSWFLVVVLDKSHQVKWYMTKLKHQDKSWHVMFSQEIIISSNAPSSAGSSSLSASSAAPSASFTTSPPSSTVSLPDHALLYRMASFMTSRFMVNAICSELDSKNAQYTLLQASDDNGNRIPTVLINMTTLKSTWSEWAHSSLLVSLKKRGSVALVQGRIRGELSPDHQKNLSGSAFSDNCGLDLDSSGRFVLSLSCNGIDDGSVFLNKVLNQLSRIERMVNYIRTIQNSKLPLLDVSMESISFLYRENDETCKVVVHFEQGDMRLELHPNSPHIEVAVPLQTILSTCGLGSVISLLRLTLPLYDAVKELQSRTTVPITVIYRSVVELRILYHRHRVSLDLRLVRRKDTTIVHVRETTERSPLKENGIWKRSFGVEGIIPLMTGAAAQMDKIGKLLTEVQGVLV